MRSHFKMATFTFRMLLVIFLVFFINKLSEAVSDDYFPLLSSNDIPLDDLIEQYFNLGFNRMEILACPLLLHGIRLSLSQLKRILSRKGLVRRGNTSSLSIVLEAIERELQGSGSIIGYRAMWQRIRNDYGLVVSRRTVRLALKVLDPVGVQTRQRHRLQRRMYKVPGPNFIWHIDGYDKLKPFGFCIHGCIDGYSRRIIWLEVGVSNNNPNVVAKYFINSIRKIGGTPKVVRSDCGTENVRTAAVQRFLRRSDIDGLAAEKSFMYGKSVSNQRIESWWGQLRKGCSDWWIDHFKSLRSSGVYCDTNIIHRECLKFCYMPVLRHELDRVVRHWNTHRIRPTRNQESPAGRPDILYFLPELQGKRDLVVNISTDDIEIAEDVCCTNEVQIDCIPEFLELAEIIMRENVLQMAQCPQTAQELYCVLLEKITALF